LENCLAHSKCATVKVVRVGAFGQFDVSNWTPIPGEDTDEVYELAAGDGYVSALNGRNGIY